MLFCLSYTVVYVRMHRGGVYFVFYLLGEPGYTTSNWYKHIIDGIFAEKRTKRFNIIMIDSIQETEKFPLESDDAILLVGSNSNWLDSIIDVCKRRFSRNIIVLGNFESQLQGKNYSIVSSDISTDIYNLYAYLLAYNKTKIAMYGINPNSASDTYRKKCFVKYYGHESDIYFNNANLKECYKSFVSNADKYDAVICANDYSAISLVRFLNNDNIKIPFIVSCGETKLAKIFKPRITNLRTNYKDFGKAAINVYKMLQKDFPISSIKLELASSINPGDTTENLPVPLTAFSEAVSDIAVCDDMFYLDNEVSEMLHVEKLLTRCDKIESDMLLSLIKGETYFEIAEKYHMSVNGVKYKLNKLFALCEVSSKNEFIELIQKYIN